MILTVPCYEKYLHVLKTSCKLTESIFLKFLLDWVQERKMIVTVKVFSTFTTTLTVAATTTTIGATTTVGK